MYQPRRTEEQQAERRELVALLGGVCRGCGFADARCLKIMPLTRAARQDYASWLSAVRKAPESYQLLCANCTWQLALDRPKKARPVSPTTADKRDFILNACMAGPVLLAELVQTVSVGWEITPKGAYKAIEELVVLG